MHLEVEELQRLLHGELPPTPNRSAREHLAVCPECRQRFHDMEQEEVRMLALLQQLDHPVRPIDPEALLGQGHRSQWWRWAAGIVLFLGVAGAAYAFPGSPLRDWVRGLVSWGTSAEELPSPVPEIQDRHSGTAGIAAAPGRKFMIAFESPVVGGVAHVSLTNAEVVTVRAPEGSASFTSSVNRLRIAGRTPGVAYEIQIPRSAPLVEIRVGERRIFLKAGSGLTHEGRTTSEGTYILPLSP